MPTKCKICNLVKDDILYKCPRCEINYCSLKCYKNPIHSSCESKFKLSELSKIINLNDNSTNLTDYENIMREIKNKQLSTNILPNNNDKDMDVDALSNADFGTMNEYYNKLSKEKKEKFHLFIKTMATSNDNSNDNFNDKKIMMTLIAHPWWIILFHFSSNSPVELLDENNLEKDKAFVISETAPHLHSKLNELSLKDMNSKAFDNYNNSIALIVHRLILIYVASIRIYGNRNQCGDPKRTIDMDRTLANALMSLVSPLVETNVEKINKFYSSYEQLFENFEVDCLNYFKNDWNYAFFEMSEQFFIEIYNDYILILNENYNETDESSTTLSTDNNSQSLHISLLFLALSDVYDIFNNLKKSADKNQPSHLKYDNIKKKISFYIAWCKHYSHCDSFRSVLNFLQFRTEYHKKIVCHQETVMTNEQFNKMRDDIRNKSSSENKINFLNLDNLKNLRF